MMSRLQEQLRGALFRGLRLVFRAVPMRTLTRDRLRQQFLARFQGVIPSGPRGLAATGMWSRQARVQSGSAAVGFVPRRPEPLPSPLPATLVAFYLPQFHAIPENDEWWGPGFTEWRNVGRALPQFEGHVQPRLPGELGYYDLRNPQTMRDQAALAREYGIGAFCFYFYWFGGKTLLEAPLQKLLQDPSIDLPFCLCWANESWTRRWDGRAGDVLIDQAHSPADDIAFIAHVACYLRDPRYLRVDGKPLLMVYRPGLLPDPRATSERWRSWCRDNGIGEITIAYVQGFERPDPRDIGFDAAVEFPPNLATPTNITAQQRLINPQFSGQILDWRELAADYGKRPMPPYRLFPGVNCGWDNEPRRPGRGRIYLHASPHGYRDWLRRTIEDRLADKPCSERLVFINAWNEWAEGAVLEPDSHLGYAWLQATRQALQQRPCADNDSPCAVIHAWYPDVFNEILAALQATGIEWRLHVTTTAPKRGQVEAALGAFGMTARIHVGDNKGRDVLPFLRVAAQLADEGEQVVLKLHTKRSPHRQDGDRWRRELVEGLVSKHRADGILRGFRSDPALGIVALQGHMQPLSYYWGMNRENVSYLAARLGMDQPTSESDLFPSGSMFWARLDALRPLLDAHLEDWEFEEEGGQIDGTLAHAIERVIGLCARQSGFKMSSAESVCGEGPGSAPERYPYAPRH